MRYRAPSYLRVFILRLRNPSGLMPLSATLMFCSGYRNAGGCSSRAQQKSATGKRAPYVSFRWWRSLLLTPRTQSATVRIGNVFGGAETLEGNASIGTQTRRSFKLGLSAPLTADMLTRGELSIYGLDRDNTAWASSKEALKGFKASAKVRPSLV